MYCNNETMECLIYQANLVLGGIIFLAQLAIGLLVVSAIAVAVFAAYLYIEDAVKWCWRKVRRAT